MVIITRLIKETSIKIVGLVTLVTEYIKCIHVSRMILIVLRKQNIVMHM
jgi:hypothetical protein